jgi:hypothetical protein
MALGSTSLVRAGGKGNQVVIRHMTEKDFKLLVYSFQ